jgi:hypothetical protein
MFVALTAAPGTTAPFWSLTAPVIVPVLAVCANAASGTVISSISKEIADATAFLNLLVLIWNPPIIIKFFLELTIAASSRFSQALQSLGVRAKTGKFLQAKASFSPLLSGRPNPSA